MSTIAKNELRFPFARQPAHCMIVDLTSQFTEDGFQAVATGISNFFSLVCTMTSGSCRVPYFAMLVMTPYTEVVLPFQKIIKSSHAKIETALTEISKLLNDGTVRAQSELDTKSLEHCIRDTVSQFQRIKQNVGSVAKLELSIIMCRSPDKMKPGIVEALSKVNLTDINHVNGVSLVTNREDGLDEVKSSPCVREIEQSTDNGLDLNGILDISRIDCDFLTIESMMKDWLRDRSIDREHLHIRFNKLNGEKNLLIKCDIRERLIDIAELPHRQCFEISIENGENTQSTYTDAGGKPGKPAPIVVLRVTKRVLCSSICESIVFGKPILLSSSNCWQMEWDELETNQNHFNALCKSLIDGKEALICENITPTPARRGVRQIEKPLGLFVIMASSSLNSLLLKSVSCRELLLSANVLSQSQWDIVPKSAMDDIERALNHVEIEAEFNPLLSQSGLIHSLRSSMRDNTANKHEQMKKYAQNNHVSFGSTGNLNTPSFHLANMKPATGKAAKFIAPRPAPLERDLPHKSYDVPTISLGPKQRQGKTVSFPDFTDF